MHFLNSHRHWKRDRIRLEGGKGVGRESDREEEGLKSLLPFCQYLLRLSKVFCSDPLQNGTASAGLSPTHYRTGRCWRHFHSPIQAWKRGSTKRTRRKYRASKKALQHSEVLPDTCQGRGRVNNLYLRSQEGKSITTPPLAGDLSMGPRRLPVHIPA